MRFEAIVARVRSEFLEMPGLELTVPQAVRLWQLGPDDCRSVIDVLVDSGFLRWTPRRTVMRTGRATEILPARRSSDISVRAAQRPDKLVGQG